MRFRGSTCRRCVEICPQAAVRLDDPGISIERTRCDGCMLCVSACPSGGLEAQRLDLLSVGAKLMRPVQPVLACTRIPEAKAHGRICCLGVLCEQLLALLALMLPQPHPLQLNLSGCGGCSNRGIVGVLRRRIQAVNAVVGAQRLVAVEDQNRLEYAPIGYDRRGFFGAVAQAARDAALEIYRGSGDPAPSRYGAKYVPRRRELLRRAVDLLPEDRRRLAARLFAPSIRIGESCSGCSACIALCPTGALGANEALPPVAWVRSRCTGCMLCGEFCPVGAVSGSCELGLPGRLPAGVGPAPNVGGSRSPGVPGQPRRVGV